MKKLNLSLVVIILITSITGLLAQTTWEKYQGNPILELGPAGSWDDHSAELCSVLMYGDNYHMWYAGYDGTNYRIGHATSSDGITWIKDSLNPILDIGMPGSWEDELIYIPCVVFDGSNFHLWYAGNDGNADRIGHAVSQDGSNWTKDPTNPVIDLGPSGGWEDFEVFPMAGSVIFNGSTFQMWYGGGATSTSSYSTGYATSLDGSSWTKDTVNNPVMTIGSPGKWDSQGAIPGTIKFDGTNYQAWYSGCGSDYRYRVGYATSVDGITWIKDSINNPVLDFEPPGNWDHLQSWNASVLFDSVSSTYKMWFNGGNFFEGRIGYATGLLTNVDYDLVNNNSQLFRHFTTYPNPFTTSTTIEYTLTQSQPVTITFYNQFGKQVDMIEQKQSAGKHHVIWIPELPVGIYYFRLEVGDQVASGKLVKMK